MKKSIWILIFFFIIKISATEIKENHLTITASKIIFISEAPQENIKGIGKQISGEILMKEKKVNISIDLTDWRTNNRLQTSHLHESYLETEKFPKATFDGTIQSYDSKTGEVKVIGSLNLHGITKKDFSINGKVSAIKNGYALKSNFSINLKDFSIEIPKLLILKVSENVNLEVNLEMNPK